MRSQLRPVFRPRGFHLGHEFLFGQREICILRQHSLASQSLDLRLLFLWRYLEHDSTISELHSLALQREIGKMEKIFAKLGYGCGHVCPGFFVQCTKLMYVKSIFCCTYRWRCLCGTDAVIWWVPQYTECDVPEPKTQTKDSVWFCRRV